MIIMIIIFIIISTIMIIIIIIIIIIIVRIVRDELKASGCRCDIVQCPPPTVLITPSLRYNIPVFSDPDPGKS